MPWDDAAAAWQPVATVQVPVADTLWLVEFALALHENSYYLRLRTYKVDALDEARVRVVGPYPDVMIALAAVQNLIREGTRNLAGALCLMRAQETRSGGPDSPGVGSRTVPLRSGRGLV